MDDITRIIGQRLRAHRLRAGLTQEELAERAELHNTYVGQVERGEKNITVISLDRLLTALGVSFPDFFEGMGTKSGEPVWRPEAMSL